MIIERSFLRFLNWCDNWRQSPNVGIHFHRNNANKYVEPTWTDNYLTSSEFSQFWTVVPEAGIKGVDKQLHPIVSVRYNHLSQPLILAFIKILLNPADGYRLVYTKSPFKPILFLSERPLGTMFNRDNLQIQMFFVHKWVLIYRADHWQYFMTSSFVLIKVSQHEYNITMTSNGRDSVSNHQPHDCLLNRLFGRRSD